MIRILHLKDSLFDAELIDREIRKNLPESTVILVSDDRQYRAALENPDFDLILSDYRLGLYDGDQALSLAKERFPDIPFIMVTCELGEDRAVETLKRGAWDYVLKNNLRRLVPAIERALKDRDRARHLRQIEEQLYREQESLRKGQQMMRLIFESATEYAIFTIDLNGYVTTWNSGAEHVLGYSEAETIGMDSRLFFIPEDQASGIPEKEMETALGEGRAVDDRWHLRKDGSRIFSHGLAFPLRDEHDTAIGFLKIMRDKTKEHAQEEALREREEANRQSEQRLTLALEAADEGMWDWNIESGYGSFTKFNSVLLGLPPQTTHITIEEFINIVHPDDKERVKTTFTKAAHGEEEWDIEYRIIRPDNGKVRWIHSTGRLMNHGNGHNSNGQFLGVSRDVTERRKSERQLRQLTKELEDRVRERTDELSAVVRDLEAFTSSVSHDLRSPLRAISSFAATIREEHAHQLDAEGMRRLNLIATSALNMSHLIDALLDFSKLGRRQVSKTTVNMKALAETVIRELRIAEPDRSLEIIADDIPPASGDQVLLRQVVANLLSNAFKFTRTRGNNARIIIGHERGENETTYFVKDNGVGFDPQLQRKLFTLFQRLHKQEEFEGTGVGLAFSKRIVERHGGKMWAESKPGEEATFYFTLPRPSN